MISDYDAGWLEDVLQQAADAAGVNLPFRGEIAKAILQDRIQGALDYRLNPCTLAVRFDPVGGLSERGAAFGL